MAEPLKVGLIGTGSISRMHLPGYQLAPDDVRLTAVCDIREAAAREFAAEAGVEAVFGDAEQLLEQSDVDAVDICTIHDQHAPLAIAAARAGKHVLLEKPMAVSLDECREILEATEEAGVTFMVAQQLRHVPSYVALRRRIQAGELGRIWSARCDTFLSAAIEDGRQPIAPRSGWWGFDGKRGGGGVITMLSVHHLDLLRYLVGEVARVEARSWTGHPSFTNDAEDRAAATLEFVNGAVGQLTASFSSRAPWSFQLLLLGEQGSAWTPPPADGSPLMAHRAPAVIASAAQEDERGFRGAQSFEPLETESLGLPTDDPYINEIQHFARCCEDGGEPISSGRDNIETMKIVFGIYESARSGAPIELAGL